MMFELQNFLPTLCAYLACFAYCSGLYLVGGNDHEQIVAIAETENSVMCFVSYVTA